MPSLFVGGISRGAFRHSPRSKHVYAQCLATSPLHTRLALRHVLGKMVTWSVGGGLFGGRIRAGDNGVEGIVVHPNCYKHGLVACRFRLCINLVLVSGAIALSFGITGLYMT